MVSTTARRSFPREFHVEAIRPDGSMSTRSETSPMRPCQTFFPTCGSSNTHSLAPARAAAPGGPNKEPRTAHPGPVRRASLTGTLPYLPLPGTFPYNDPTFPRVLRHKGACDGRAGAVQLEARRSSERLVQHHARPRAGDAAVAAAAPGDARTGGSGRPLAAVPRVADHAGGLDRPVDRHPGSGAGHLPAVEADAALPRA